VLAAATGSDWSSAGSLLTFYFPVGLFIVIGTTLYLEFNRPHLTPGRKRLAAAGTIAVTQAAASRQSETAASPTPAPAADSAARQQDAAGADHDDEAPSADS
jgi:hypothetical protein